MGMWSGITHAVGGIVKNTIKVGVGYAAGEAIENVINDSDDPAKSGAAGLIGVAGIYAAPAVGSKLMDFVKNHGSSSYGPGTSCWGFIVKSVATFAGGSFLIWQGGKLLNDYADANDNVHDPGKNEYLQLEEPTSEFSAENTSAQANHTGDELIENIQTESQSSEPEMTGL